MKTLIFVLLFCVLSPAHSASPQMCIEMMKLHYMWIDLEKCDLAARQLESAEKACNDAINNPMTAKKLEQLVRKDDALVFLYEKLMNKNANPQSICPKKLADF